MRKVRVLAKTEEPVGRIWDIIIDIKNWDKLIKFVKKIYIKDEVKVGTKFYDVTTILLFPTRIEHKILEIDKYKKFQMEAYMPFNNGKILQTILIKDKSKYKEVEIEISFKINSLLLDLLFGHILETRLKVMVTKTLLKLQENLNEKNKKSGVFRESELLT